MKIFDEIEAGGQLCSFQFSNLLVSRRRASEVAASIPGVKILKWPRRWALSDDDFCRFRLGDREFVVCEPWGDNSRFMVHGERPGWCPELETIRSAFKAARPVAWPWKMWHSV